VGIKQQICKKLWCFCVALLQNPNIKKPSKTSAVQELEGLRPCI